MFSEKASTLRLVFLQRNLVWWWTGWAMRKAHYTFRILTTVKISSYRWPFNFSKPQKLISSIFSGKIHCPIHFSDGVVSKRCHVATAQNPIAQFEHAQIKAQLKPQLPICKIYCNTSDLATPQEQTSCRFRENKTFIPCSKKQQFPPSRKQWAVLEKKQWICITD